MLRHSTIATRSASSQAEPKTAHRFKLGDTVVSFAPGIPLGPYVIVRLLPLIDGEPHYQARHKDGHMRALLERQLRVMVREGSREACASSGNA